MSRMDVKEGPLEGPRARKLLFFALLPVPPGTYAAPREVGGPGGGSKNHATLPVKYMSTLHVNPGTQHLLTNMSTSTPYMSR